MSYQLTGLLGNFSNAYAQLLLKHFLNKTPHTPENISVALFKTTPTDASPGTEPTGGSYARAATTGATWTAPTGTDRYSTNASAITFVQATSNWGTITHFGLFEASSGTYLGWGEFNTSFDVESGDIYEIAVNELTLQFPATP